MKNKILLPISILVSFAFSNAQTVVINDKLLTQLTKNQVVRLASNESYLNSYKKQKKLYDDVNLKIAQVVAIQDFIYSNLVNVNSAIKQGKQMFYLSKTFVQIGQNAQDVLSLSAQHPEYAILLNRYYIGATQELLKLKTELTRDILREDADFLMDPYDREILIRNISTKAQLINGYLIAIKIRLKNAKSIPYIYQIPIISNYVNLDKMIIRDIVTRYQIIF